MNFPWPGEDGLRVLDLADTNVDLLVLLSIAYLSQRFRKDVVNESFAICIGFQFT